MRRRSPHRVRRGWAPFADRRHRHPPVHRQALNRDFCRGRQTLFRALVRPRSPGGADAPGDPSRLPPHPGTQLEPKPVVCGGMGRVWVEGKRAGIRFGWQSSGRALSCVDGTQNVSRQNFVKALASRVPSTRDIWVDGLRISERLPPRIQELALTSTLSN